MNIEIPKIIWILWFQGWENTPKVVHKCRTTWIEHNSDWTIHFLTLKNLSDFVDLDTVLPGYKEKNLPPEALSNVIRLALLIKYGGVWIDSTVYCNKPLNDWLPQHVIPSGFFAFANPGPDRMLSNWFLAASPNHIISKKWYEECLTYWSTRTERHTYHWCHYLFGDLYKTDGIIKELWDKTFKLPADAPHFFLPYEETLYQPLSRKVKKVIDKSEIPLFKLTFKYDEQRVNAQSVMQYLLSDKKKVKSAKTIIIVGMHRSGTSLTASLLQESGLDIGDELLASGIGNVRGHYENMDFLNFHIKMLDKNNYDPNGWDEVDIESLDLAGETEAKKIIERNESILWGWKDPRTTLFLNFWAKLLPGAYFLFLYRAPEEVIDSFYKRGTDSFLSDQPEKVIDLWLHYNKLILKYHEKFKDRSLLLNIKSIIHAYPECISKINEKFRVRLNPTIRNLFEKELFNEDPARYIFWGRLLYSLRPEVRQIYEELLSKSWHPSGIDYQCELSIEHKNNEVDRVFFNQWRDQYFNESKVKNICEAQLQQLKQQYESQTQELNQKYESDINALKKVLVDRDRFGQDRQAELDWMRKSVFWKLRIIWQKIRSTIGVGGE